ITHRISNFTQKYRFIVGNYNNCCRFYLVANLIAVKFLALLRMRKIVIIQTAFLGDVILITPIIRELKLKYPNACIDVLVRKGNESVLANNPYIRSILIW